MRYGLIKSPDSYIMNKERMDRKGGMAMQITATEFKSNIGKYLALVERQDILITKNGKNVAKLSNPNADKVALLDSLVGVILDASMTLDEARGERLGRQ